MVLAISHKNKALAFSFLDLEMTLEYLELDQESSNFPKRPTFCSLGELSAPKACITKTIKYLLIYRFVGINLI